MAAAGIALLMTACDNNPEFKVEGEVYGGEGKTLILAKPDFAGRWTVLDSVKVGKNGDFSLKYIICGNAQNTSSGEGSGQGIIMAGGSVTAKMLTLTENGFRYEVTNAWLPFPKVNESGQPYCYIAFR